MVYTIPQSRRNYDTFFKLLKNADYILLHFTDLLGYLKGRTIPAEQGKKAIAEGVTFDGSSMIGGVNIEDSDMIMKPDPSTFTVCPYYFYDKSVVSLICDIKEPDGRQFETDSRHICRKTIEKAMTKGYNPTSAAELEFYLVTKNAQDQITPVESHLIDRQRYFDNAPGRDLTEPYRMDLSTVLSTMGIIVERQHHEAGSAQNEITFRYADPLSTSDNIMRYKFSAKAVAEKKYNWTATFMPKPWHNKAGSGMHIHLGLFDSRTGENPFHDPNGYAYISQKCRYFIGGLLEHAKALCAIVAPSINSYKRLVPGYEAPIHVSWSKRNRSALVRIPAFPPENEDEARVEFRCPDPLCNPYLAYAVTLEAGLDGIDKRIDPGDPVEANVYHLSEKERKKLGLGTLPTSLKDALEEWKSDEICSRALGKETAEKYADAKTREWQEYLQHVRIDDGKVAPWEVQKYLYA